MQHIGHREGNAILGAMLQVALAHGGPLTQADTVSISAAAHYLMRRPAPVDIGALPVVGPRDLAAALAGSRLANDLAGEAIRYLTVMALVDGALDDGKIARVLEYARALDVEEDYLTEMVEAASHHMAWAIADMTRKNMESITSGPWANADEAPAWLMPYVGEGARPELVARFEALSGLADNTFGKAYWSFYKENGFAFPGDPAGLNEMFATHHDSAHVLSSYDTSPRGEILVSTFIAAMHPVNSMAGHILPVIFNGHLGIKFNDIARYTTGGLDPDEFWHAWARGRETNVDILSPGYDVWSWVERDIEDVRREFNISPPGLPH